MGVDKFRYNIQMDLEIGDHVQININPIDLGFSDKYKYSVFKITALDTNNAVAHLVQVKPFEGEKELNISVNINYLGYIKESKAEATSNALFEQYNAWIIEQKKLYEALETEITKIKQLLTDVYGENYQFEDNLKTHKSGTITIKFPEFIIRNSNANSRTIKDLYVQFKLALTPKNNLYVSGDLVGTRGSCSIAELMSNYSHSHLPSSTKLGQFAKFCLGSTNIAMNLGLLRDHNTPFNFDNFELLIHQLETYVSWESLEGGPHIKMHDIKSRQDLNQVIDDDSIKAAYKQFVSKKFHFDPTYNQADKSFKVKSNTQLEVDLGTCTTHQASKVQSAYYSTATPENAERIRSQYSTRFNGNHMYFKGQKVTYNVYSDLPTTEAPILVANPGITSGVLKLLEERLNLFALNHSDHILEAIKMKEEAEVAQ